MRLRRGAPPTMLLAQKYCFRNSLGERMGELGKVLRFLHKSATFFGNLPSAFNESLFHRTCPQCLDVSLSLSIFFPLHVLSCTSSHLPFLPLITLHLLSHRLFSHLYPAFLKPRAWKEHINLPNMISSSMLTNSLRRRLVSFGNEACCRE